MVWIEKIRPSGSLFSDPRDRFFYPHHIPMKDTYNLLHLHVVSKSGYLLSKLFSPYVSIHKSIRATLMVFGCFACDSSESKLKGHQQRIDRAMTCLVSSWVFEPMKFDCMGSLLPYSPFALLS